ncbi:hypothetical protein ACFO1V_11830 [Daeguia caeni]|uniref:Uncharacterized protein n=1 Tax=Daeguia caeni TaxID=439612 RepID=A0ABV9H9V1_9HYPH
MTCAEKIRKFTTLSKVADFRAFCVRIFFMKVFHLHRVGPIFPTITRISPHESAIPIPESPVQKRPCRLTLALPLYMCMEQKTPAEKIFAQAVIFLNFALALLARIA